MRNCLTYAFALTTDVWHRSICVEKKCTLHLYHSVSKLQRSVAERLNKKHTLQILVMRCPLKRSVVRAHALKDVVR